jgi:hypothetical protein
LQKRSTPLHILAMPRRVVLFNSMGEVVETAT